MFGRFIKNHGDELKETVDSSEEKVVEDRREPTVVEHDEALERYVEMKVDLHRQLLTRIDFSQADRMSNEEFGSQVRELIAELVASNSLPLNMAEREQLINDVVAEVTGYGPIEPFLKDPTVTDILVNTHRKVFVERFGRLEITSARFADTRHLMRIIQKIVAQVGRRVDESQPMVDARLPDGSRVNAVVPPVAVDGPLMSIRKFAQVPITIAKMLELGTLTDEMRLVMQSGVKGKLSVLISGGTGSGKTTLLNALSASIGDRERIVTIEDAAELQLQQTHVARLETRPPNVEGKGEIRQRELVKNALRMRPDRIIVGEVRAGEAFDMLQAMNTGHEGSMTTIHANSPRDALSRLEQMIGMAEIDIPTQSMRAQIASALDMVIQTQRMSDGTRRITSVSEITGMEGPIIQMQEIFRFDRETIRPDGTIVGKFLSTGIRPYFMPTLRSQGIELDPEIFREDRVLGRTHEKEDAR